MRRLQILLSLALLGSAFAQDSTRAVAQTTPAPRFGFGVSIGPATVLLADAGGSYPSEQFLSGFYASITGTTFKLEPEVAVSRIKATEEAGNYTYEQSYMAMRLGAGLFRMSPIGQTVLYFGGRTGVILESVSQEYDSDFAGEGDSEHNSRTNFYVGPAVGAEHFLGKNFSIGAEGQLVFTFFGDYSGNGEFAEDAETSFTSIDNRVLLFLRWYY
jgi:hypothetical protein